MLRTALLTADPALRSAVSADVLPCPGCLIDLRALSRSSAALDCDLLIVDLRQPGHDWTQAPRASYDVPTLAIVNHGPGDATQLHEAHLPLAAQRNLTIVRGDAPDLLEQVGRFIAQHAGPVRWRARWGNYVLQPSTMGVQILDHGALRLSEHKFRFVLSLFLHRRVRLHWTQMHWLAWGGEEGGRASAVAAHAEWAREVLELDGRHGYELVSAHAYYELRRRISSRRVAAPEPPPPPEAQRSDDFADSTPGAL